MLRIVLTIFFITHGLVHAALAVAPNPVDQEARPGAFFTAAQRSWLLPRLGLNASAIRWIGMTLVALSALGFVLAGLGIFGVAGLSLIWQAIAMISACVSFSLLTLFWHPWLPAGVLIDLGTLVALLWARWPPSDLIGS